MADVLINDEHLYDIADAIRNKTGSEDTYKPREMAGAIEAIEGRDPECTGLHVSEEDLVIGGNCQYCFAYGKWDFIVNNFGDKIKTEDIWVAAQMFTGCELEGIPFALNFDEGRDCNIANIFDGCKNLREAPEMNNLRPTATSSIFTNCHRLREIPDGFSDSWDWTLIDSATSQYSASRGSQFQYCYSLRKLPMEFLNHGNPNPSTSYAIYYNLFNGCYALDEVINLPVQHLSAALTSNVFSSTFNQCCRLKDMTFALDENSQPYVIDNWKNQIIDLSVNVGYGSASNITSYNSGITKDKLVTDADSYALLKDDEDWFTTIATFSRYNRESAERTIASLPDVSASGGVNTIKFKGAAGSGYGMAINTLSPEEVAIGTQKGWTISFS